MSMEKQRSVPNPEWEIDREQNIAIAKRIDGLLIKAPGSVEKVQQAVQGRIEDLEEMQAVNEIIDMEEHGYTKQDIPDDVKAELTIEELTIGHTTALSHIDNRYRRIFLGVGLSDEARELVAGIRGFIDLLPQAFNFPVYIIKGGTESIYDDSHEFDASTIDGNLPNDIIGADGLYYSVRNIYCFNVYGQGLKIEEIYNMTSAKDWYGEEAERLPRVDFVPSEEHSRVVPLGPEDYAKINRMFEQIDAGLYKFRA